MDNNHSAWRIKSYEQEEEEKSLDVYSTIKVRVTQENLCLIIICISSMLQSEMKPSAPLH